MCIRDRLNDRLVPPGEEPKSWRDLTDPKWKGKILSDDMRAVGGGYVAFFVTQEKLGKAYHEVLATQSIQFTREMREAGRRVARGEMAIYMPFMLSDIQNLKGLPVRAVVLAEGAPYVLYATALIKGAPHPNAARAFLLISLCPMRFSRYLRVTGLGLCDAVFSTRFLRRLAR